MQALKSMGTLNISVDSNNIQEVIAQLLKFKSDLEQQNAITIEEWIISHSGDKSLTHSTKLLALNIFREKFHKDPRRIRKSEYGFSKLEEGIIQEAYNLVKRREEN